MRTKIVIAVCMLLIGAVACGRTEAPEGTPHAVLDISGTYAVSGTSLDGGNYTGEAVISQTTGNDYRIDWTIGGDLMTGMGTFDGAILKVDWEIGTTASGTASYARQPDGSLTGTWTQHGAQGEGTETLTPR